MTFQISWDTENKAECFNWSQERIMTFQWSKKLRNLSTKKNILRKHNLPSTHNRNLGNLGKCSFASNFDSSCNLRFRNNKNELRQKLKVIKRIKEKKENFRDFRVFDFALHPKSKTRKSRKAFFYFKF